VCVGALRSTPVAGALIMRGLASLTGEVLARRLMSRRMPFWETPSPALPDGRVSSSGDLSHPNIAAPLF
jgi:hypothetical protein